MGKTTQDFVNDRYKELCATHADLTNRRKGMDAQISDIEKQIEGLNFHVPMMHQLEDRIREQLKRDEALAAPVNVTNLVDGPK